jgi:uridine phosphorylase
VNKSEQRHHIPLLEHPLETASAFTPESLIDAVKVSRKLPSISVPDVCVLEFDGDLTDHLVQSGAVQPWPTWACFHTPMFAMNVDGMPCGIVPRAIGGPYAVLVAEQLLASGAKVIVGLTSAGRISPQLSIPSLVVATAAIRDEGTSYHYLPPARTVAAPATLISPLESHLKQLGLPVQSGLVWTTDAPYRETQEQIEAHAAERVLAVEMQAASLFALAQVRKAQIGVVAHVSNAIDHTGEPFDKGADVEGIRVLQALFRAGLAGSRNQ